MNKYKYLGKSKVAFENGCIYEAEKGQDDVWQFYSVKDESGEWYCYGVPFFEDNFVLVEFDSAIKNVIEEKLGFTLEALNMEMCRRYNRCMKSGATEGGYDAGSSDLYSLGALTREQGLFVEEYCKYMCAKHNEAR